MCRSNKQITTNNTTMSSKQHVPMQNTKEWKKAHHLGKPYKWGQRPTARGYGGDEPTMQVPEKTAVGRGGDGDGNGEGGETLSGWGEEECCSRTLVWLQRVWESSRFSPRVKEVAGPAHRRPWTLILYKSGCIRLQNTIRVCLLSTT